MVDKHGNLLEKYQDVIVPEPNKTDIHNNAFIGTVIDVLESRGTAIVEDQCGEVFEVETDRLEVNE